MTASAQVGYENSQYYNFDNRQSARDTNSFGVRWSNNYVFVRPCLEYRIGPSGRIQAYYEYRHNDSTEPGLVLGGAVRFADNRVGLILSWAF